jgi:hypothetical protein
MQLDIRQKKHHFYPATIDSREDGSALLPGNINEIQHRAATIGHFPPAPTTSGEYVCYRSVKLFWSIRTVPYSFKVNAVFLQLQNCA